MQAYLIVGLGNPTQQYRLTRHNIGFLTIDYLVQTWKVNQAILKWQSLVWKYKLKNAVLYLIKPQTYINRSGESVLAAKEYFKVETKNIIVIQDDKDMALGKLKIKTQGTSGGHNGIKNILHLLQTDNFIRLKIGIGSSPHVTTTKWVLTPFTKSELNVLKPKIIKVATALCNYFNTKQDVNQLKNALHQN